MVSHPTPIKVQKGIVQNRSAPRLERGLIHEGLARRSRKDISALCKYVEKEVNSFESFTNHHLVFPYAQWVWARPWEVLKGVPRNQKTASHTVLLHCFAVIVHIPLQCSHFSVRFFFRTKGLVTSCALLINTGKPSEKQSNPLYGLLADF